jgi:phosphoenolpyruvate synthase/pyruvate phosphate dikinase
MLVLSFKQVFPEHAPLVGGKARARARLAREGLRVPDGIAITTEAYDEFVSATGLRNRIARELTWRPVERMRWEEMWDASLRIRNAFAGEPLPPTLDQALLHALRESIGKKPVAVRSSAPGEDASGQSFAGLHDSYVNYTKKLRDMSQSTSERCLSFGWLLRMTRVPPATAHTSNEI